MTYKVCFTRYDYNASRVNLALMDLTKFCNTFVNSSINERHIKNNILF